MSNFDIAIVSVIDHEGVLSTDRNDRGNWTSGVVGEGEFKGTKYGISGASYPDLDIAALTLNDAKAIYKRDWWDKYGYGRIINQVIATKLFDAAVNEGAIQAHKLLQRATWSINGYASIDDDGVLGNVSLVAINSVPSPVALIAAFRSEMAGFYRLICHNPLLAKDETGFLKRSYA